MASIQPKTYHAKPGDVERHWFVIDAAGQTVGRLASRVAHILRGKHKPQFTPSIDVGDFVIIINAEKIVFKGDKMDDKIYYRTTTRPGSMKKINARALLEKNPTKILEDAIWGMVPHNTLGRQQIRKLNVYAGETHPHQAQSPQVLEPTAIGVG